jgi:transposase
MQRNAIRKLLNIPEYKVVKVLSESKEIHVWLEPYKRKVSICSGCGKSHEGGYHGVDEVVVRDLPLGEMQTFLHVPKKRYRCLEDDRIHIEEIGWLKFRSRVAKKFGEQVYRLTAITTNQEAGWYLGIGDEVVTRIDKAVLEEKAKEKLEPIPAAINISVDEVSYRKYHRYLTNVIDTDKRLIIWNDRGRKAEILNRYYEGIGGDNCKKIESVAMDGARTYISSTTKYAINALIVYDKFHIMQKLNNTVDAVRKDELCKARKNDDEQVVALTNCRQRFILLKNKKKLTEKQSEYLKTLCEINEPIYKAMLLKESFLEIYNHHKVEDAEAVLKSWLTQAASSGLQSFQELAVSFTDKMNYILNWFKKRISSSISEGFNNKIKRLRRMAYGYKDIDYFRLKIHQHCGLLSPKLAS